MSKPLEIGVLTLLVVGGQEPPTPGAVAPPRRRLTRSPGAPAAPVSEDKFCIPSNREGATDCGIANSSSSAADSSGLTQPMQNGELARSKFALNASKILLPFLIALPLNRFKTSRNFSFQFDPKAARSGSAVDASPGSLPRQQQRGAPSVSVSVARARLAPLYKISAWSKKSGFALKIFSRKNFDFF